MSTPQVAFLEGEFFNCTVRGAFGRNSVYTKPTTDVQRAGFRDTLRGKLDVLADQYRNKAVSEETHFENVCKLSHELSAEHAYILQDKRFRIGTAQKALNLYLKYLWCLGSVNTPPHCPFDSIVIEQLPSCATIKWTTLDDLTEYRQLVTEAKKQAAEAGFTSIAQWELETYGY
jgi:hypothetical protein